ncbi:Regulatory protein AtoC [Vibrio stylophorae]|uniref:Regulatory protein AtoC n=1 Tax=Vibrio stylophorae TaxID=659351 RepID=A0ABN8DNE3_9VIBR|nr:sigma-54 dependent transcriptional regulator [Vibrio stylophorae]CAH0532681.1 Regulatory protein AtoC [Vibrio stylophorae]
MPFRNRKVTKPGTLVIVGGGNDSWLQLLERAGWRCHRCLDLRAAQALFQEIGPCIGIADLSHDDFSLQGVASLANKNKQVRWMALVRDDQLSSEVICQFIVNFCLDYFTAPVPDNQLLAALGHQLGMLQLECHMWPHLSDHHDMGLLGDSSAMRKLREQLRRVAPTDVAVLVTGENGTGKELVAKALHNASPRGKGPFVAVGRQIAEQSVASDISMEELATVAFSEANHGTLYIDEVGDLSTEMQAELLHFLQENGQQNSQLGHHKDVRVIAATHMDLEKAVSEGRFREDLFYRLNVLRIQVPPLRERSMDICLLAEHFVQKFAREYASQARSVSDSAKQILQSYSWPGNVRELINIVKRAVLLADHHLIEAEHLDIPHNNDLRHSLRKAREDSERDALVSVLEMHNGQVTAAAKELGVSRATMYRLLNKHDLVPSPRAKKPA